MPRGERRDDCPELPEAASTIATNSIAASRHRRCSFVMTSSRRHTESHRRPHTALWWSGGGTATLVSLLSLLIAGGLMIAPARGLANCPPGCQCDDDTLVVKCGEGTLDVLPIALNPSIQRLVIKNNKIKTIDSSIQFYAELTFLDLSFNNLITIPPRTFAYQRKLQELHLNHNEIGQINNKTFGGLTAITVLNLRGNLLAELEARTFAPMTRIEELNLGQNRISRIDVHAFDGLTQLRVLYLDDNTLTSVPDPGVLQAMPNLAELFLGTNSFMTLPNDAFVALKGLTKLNLSGAGLHNVSSGSLNGLEGVRILDLSDNRLQTVPTDALMHLERLEELSIGQNDYDVISAGAFAGLKNLRRLEVIGAQRLRRIENGAFATNTNLEYVNMSANKLLNDIEKNVLDGLPHLRHVIMRENQLGTLAEGLIPWRDLETFDISDNPFVCDCRVLWLRQLMITRNSSADQSSRLLCAAPELLRDASLVQLSPTDFGCSYTDHNRQIMMGVMLFILTATVTAIILTVYFCRGRIRKMLKGGFWGNSALGRKEREYQKTCSDDECMSRQACPYNLAAHSAASVGFPGSVGSGAGGFNVSYMEPRQVTDL